MEWLTSVEPQIELVKIVRMIFTFILGGSELQGIGLSRWMNQVLQRCKLPLGTWLFLKAQAFRTFNTPFGSRPAYVPDHDCPKHSKEPLERQ